MTFDEQAATLDRKGIVGLLTENHQLTEHVQELKTQLDWLKNQMFGTKSERRFVDPDGRQLSLGEWKTEDASGTEITIAEHCSVMLHCSRPPNVNGHDAHESNDAS